MKYFTIFLLLLIIPNVHAENPFHLGEITWTRQLYQESSDTQATIRITDIDMNKTSDSTDKLEISVWSDTDSNGIVIVANETSANSGIFEGIVHLTNQETQDNKLKVTVGDSIHAKYVDTTYPLPYDAAQDIIANAFIGRTGPPLEPINASDWGIFDSKGNTVESVNVGQMALIQTSLTNNLDSAQSLAYIVVINDENDSEVYRSHLQNTLEPKVTITSAISWTPEETGHYIATIMIWRAIDNPTSLSPTLESEFDVVNSDSTTTSGSGDNAMTHLSPPLTQFKSGVSLDKIQCKEGLKLVLKSLDSSPACVTPETKQILIECGWAKTTTVEKTPSSENMEKDTIAKLLAQNQIEYLPDKLVVTGVPVFNGDPRCGVVVDVNSTIHWFTVDSISKPQKMKFFSENPNPCVVNTSSCFCNAQMDLTALTLDNLSYFGPEEEEKFANILMTYLANENINRTPKFLIGKFNLNYTDPYAIGYCGELWGYNKLDFFDGAIVTDQVMDYGLERKLSPLCAISEDAQWWERN